jgi:peptide deformylase
MAIRPILRIGDPRLREVSKPVETFDTPELHELIEDMFETMEAADGAGLAAPQIGVLQRIMIFGVDENPRYPEVESVPTTVLINPEFSVVSDEIEGFWEGCLSVPGMH